MHQEEEIIDKLQEEIEKFRSKIIEMEIHPSFYSCLLFIETIRTIRDYYPEDPEVGFADYKDFARKTLEEIIQNLEINNSKGKKWNTQ